MKILILTQGSRGDFQPFAALAWTLSGAGHDVLFGAPSTATELVTPASIRVIPFRDIAKALVADPDIRETISKSDKGLRGRVMAARTRHKFKTMMSAVLDDLAAAIEPGIDVVVHHALLPGHEVAERLGVPAVPVCLVPAWVPTRSFTSPLWPIELPRMLNPMSYWSTGRSLRPVRRRVNRRWRNGTLGLPARRGHRNVLRRPDGGPAVVLQPISRHLLPPALDYPPWVHTTGYWFLPVADDWSPPSHLAEFVAAGEPPVYIGFGSMAGGDPRESGRMIVDAVRRAGTRAIVAMGWGGLDIDGLKDDICVVDQAPHEWLLPRTSAIVHHGGAGTTGAALSSGRPQIICPFLNDQHFWAKLALMAGVATATLPQSRLSERTLADAISRALTDRRVREKADQIGHHVRDENGLAAATKILESLV